jgi:hypothetical protein
MQEFIKRLRLFETVMRPFVHDGTVSIANCELAALQLRKMYELVGFASISANKARYVEIRKSFEKDWNLAEILSRIEQFNPAFLPIGLQESWKSGTTNDPHMISADGPRFEKKQLLENHGRLGRLLHARNPYAEEIDYRQWHVWMIERCKELMAVTECHAVVIEYQKTMYRVAMCDAETNDVMVAIMNSELAQ